MDCRLIKHFVLLGTLAAVIQLLATPVMAGLIMEYAPIKKIVPAVVLTPSVSEVPITSEATVPAFVAPSSIFENNAARPKKVKSIIYHGVTPSNVALIKGNADNESLSSILRKLVPRDWRAFARVAKIQEAGSFSYIGSNRSWSVVLDEVLRSTEFIAFVDWERKEITFATPARQTATQ